jgi:hypothetical protein
MEMKESSKKTSVTAQLDSATVPAPLRYLVVAQPNPAAIPAPLRYYDPELQDALNTEERPFLNGPKSLANSP